MIDLGTLPGGYSSAGSSINNTGQITGSSTISSLGQSHAFLYKDGEIRDLGSLAAGQSSSYGLGINDAGQITGGADSATGLSHAFLYRNGQMIDLGTLSEFLR